MTTDAGDYDTRVIVYAQSWDAPRHIKNRSRQLLEAAGAMGLRVVGDIVGTNDTGVESPWAFVRRAVESMNIPFVLVPSISDLGPPDIARRHREEIEALGTRVLCVDEGAGMPPLSVPTNGEDR